MRIIRKVEINYFRSIYSTSLSDLSDLNVLVGGNDVGKSNFLKALNLFFNNETELDHVFSFYEDLSRIREREARSAKGRATIWIKVTFNNYENWASLPKTFVIKKTWTRYESLPEVSYPGNPDIPNTMLGKFLNKISFHYIPAIRGRGIFAYYLNMLHDSLIEDERAGIASASSQLMDVINTSTEGMSKKIAERLGFDSSIGAPRDLRQLFSALDFQTKFGDYDIPLQRRGDGIQARHIPFILDFVANRSRKNHIWAYEEPENSLEMAKSFDLAEQFQKEFSERNQVFITTHSPAFYDLNGSEVTRWLVESSPHQSLDEACTQAKPLHRSETSDEVVGVAALISDRARILHLSIEGLKNSNARLSEGLQRSNLPQVVVEGPSDKKIFELTCRVAGYDSQWCEFVDAGNAQHVTGFLQSLDRLNRDENKPVVGLLDRDDEGSRAIRPFLNRHLFPESEIRIINQTKSLYCVQLPIPEHVRKANDILNTKIELSKELPVTIESMISPETIMMALKDGVIEFEPIITVAKTNNYEKKINLSEDFKQYLPEELQYLVHKVKSYSKMVFAEWLETHAGKSDVQAISGFLESIRKVCVKS